MEQNASKEPRTLLAKVVIITKPLLVCLIIVLIIGLLFGPATPTEISAVFKYTDDRDERLKLAMILEGHPLMGNSGPISRVGLYTSYLVAKSYVKADRDREAQDKEIAAWR